MADDNKNEVPVVERPPSQALEIAKRIAIVAGIIISGVLGAVAAGSLSLPPVALGILNTILGILAALGLASSGLAPKPPKMGPPEG